MTLEPLDLDDLTWTDLVDQVREAIPAESNRQWTLHAPVDPGITILELFAARLEERLYWLDRAPNDLIRAVLRLLGSAPPHRARPATTVLRFVIDEGRIESVPAGSGFRRSGSDPGDELTTDDELTVVGGADLRVVVDGVDRTAELGPNPVSTASGDPFGATRSMATPGFDLFPVAGGPGRIDLSLRIPSPVGAAADRRLGMAFVLDTAPELLPGWAIDAPDDVPSPATLVWRYRTTADRFAALDGGAFDDGTGGLRRSGIVRFVAPGDGWRPTDGGGSEFTLRISTEAATFSAPPRLIGVWPNTVAARHLRTVELEAPGGAGIAGNGRNQLVDQIRSWLPLPGLEIEIPGTAGRLLAGAEPPWFTLVEGDGQAREWRPVDDFSSSGPGDRVFVVDRERGSLRFGDGYAGRIPVPGRDPSGAPLGLTVRYRIGGGSAGNRGSDLVWQPTDDRLAFDEVVNVVAVTGGADQESVNEARRRAKADLARRHRAVTGGDHRTMVVDPSLLGVAVARVHVTTGRHPAHPCRDIPGAVTVIVIPDVSVDPATSRPVVSAPRPDPGMLDVVAARLGSGRLLGAEIFVEGPTYRPVEVVARLDGGTTDLEPLQRTVFEALARHLDPLVGGEGEGWPFGSAVRPSDLLGVIQNALGSTAEIASVAIGIDGAAPTVDCDDIALEPHELPQLVGVTVAPGPRSGPSGGLR